MLSLTAEFLVMFLMWLRENLKLQMWLTFWTEHWTEILWGKQFLVRRIILMTLGGEEIGARVR